MVGRRIEQSMNVRETRMLRRMSGQMREDRMRNKCVSGSVGVASMVGKMGENGLRRFGRVMTRAGGTEAVKAVTRMTVGAKRGGGKPKERWSDTVENGTRTAGVERVRERSEVTDPEDKY